MAGSRRPVLESRRGVSVRVLRDFDRYRTGDIMTPADVADQQARGNLPDLIRNGFVKDPAAAPPPVAAAPPMQGISGLNLVATDKLREMARGRGIRGWHNMRRDTLIARLSDGNN